MKDFRDLKVWKKAHELALTAYAVTTNFPEQELFGIVGQIRRAATSVPANIAEGCGRAGNAEFQRFLHMAMGSATELEYHLLLSRDLRLLSLEDYEAVQTQVVEVKRMLAGLIRKVTADRS